MIGKLKGAIEHIDSEMVIISTGGIGYIIFCVKRLLDKIELYEDREFFIEQQYKDDGVTLYGFETWTERNYFTYLKSIQGVGGRLALNIVNEVLPSELLQIIQSDNKKSLQSVTGVGSRLAIKIVAELSSKKKLEQLESLCKGGLYHTKADKEDMEISQAVISAIVNLGFSKHQAVKAVQTIIENTDHKNTKEKINFESLFKATLKILSSA